MLKQVDKINYRIVRPLGTLGTNGNITTELNLISYNNYKPKLDLRKWEKKGDNKILQRGLTLTDDEAKNLYNALKDYLEHKEANKEGFNNRKEYIEYKGFRGANKKQTTCNQATKTS